MCVAYHMHKNNNNNNNSNNHSNRYRNSIYIYIYVYMICRAYTYCACMTDICLYIQKVYHILFRPSLSRTLSVSKYKYNIYIYIYAYCPSRYLYYDHNDCPSHCVPPQFVSHSALTVLVPPFLSAGGPPPPF